LSSGAPLNRSQHESDPVEICASLEEIFGRSRALDDHAVLASVGSVGDASNSPPVGWFNNARLHESLGDVPPAEYEQLQALREA
jgi:hypothetical protein